MGDPAPYLVQYLLLSKGDSYVQGSISPHVASVYFGSSSTQHVNYLVPSVPGRPVERGESVTVSVED